MDHLDWQRVSSLLASLARPVRMWVWMIVIVIIVIYVLITGGHEDKSGILVIIVTGFFADLGVNSFLRTNEKNVQAKVDGAQKSVETLVDPGNSSIENQTT